MMRRFSMSYLIFRETYVGSFNLCCDTVTVSCKLRNIRSLTTIPFTVNKDGYVEAYTDGACRSNGTSEAKAGIGVWFGDNHPMNLSEPIIGNLHTNNSAEIQAARRAICAAKDAGITKLNLKTDSQFVINCMTKWIHVWRQNNWKLTNGKPVKNRDELEKLFAAAKGLKVAWSYVPAHTGFVGNVEADRLAVEGSKK